MSGVICRTGLCTAAMTSRLRWMTTSFDLGGTLTIPAWASAPCSSPAGGTARPATGPPPSPSPAAPSNSAPTTSTPPRSTSPVTCAPTTSCAMPCTRTRPASRSPRRSARCAPPPASSSDRPDPTGCAPRSNATCATSGPGRPGPGVPARRGHPGRRRHRAHRRTVLRPGRAARGGPHPAPGRQQRRPPANSPTPAPVAPVAAVQNRYGGCSTGRTTALVDECASAGIAYMPFFALGGGHAPLAGENSRRSPDRHGVTEFQVAIAWGLARSPSIVQIPRQRLGGAFGGEHGRGRHPPRRRRHGAAVEYGLAGPPSRGGLVMTTARTVRRSPARRGRH